MPFTALSTLFIGITLLIAGLVLSFVEIEINDFIGYRTKRSKSSKEAWNYANKACGKLLALNGAINIMWGWATFNNYINPPLFMDVLILLAGLALMIYYIEQQLSKKFGN